MTKQLQSKLRPKQGYAHYFHLGFTAVLPILVFIFVRLDLATVALAVILLSKWRMFAVRPRHWFAHIRTNAVDIIFSLSILAFMTSTTEMSYQLFWVAIYELWILFIKPGTSPIMVSLQALIAQLGGLIALFAVFEDVPLGVFIIGVALVLYFSARHFFASFEEPNIQAYCWIWTLFGASITWLLGHWLLFFGPVSQLALLLGVMGYGLAGLYYLAATDKLSTLAQRQIILVMIAAVILVLGYPVNGEAPFNLK